ncbi:MULTISPECIES: hypothetical protein [Desulfofundulus]|uniref:Uncharacterized protein n=1 Tax=Desulfofundulus australicus DSM 11792 TaxID=1121425 RepID=A0A1M5DQF8_9FIRM|nr:MULTISPECIES: hypothetical protein [Desulfofundulus]MBE3584983.1 hypothetical protein [Thermoanaerobacter sp.]MCS5694612.1 hypothetical protein [Desulfofundulus thermocisternus]MDK2889100.1 hypothetical protein [Thermoanaerobacter sp.]SHF69268.1 hypothetical protein SAMN02745218_02889 [Desulfofundulus australicus DSM 11792]
MKVLRDGASYSHREVVDLLVEFSAFKDRVEKKFKELARELDGKNNEHELWVNLYLISTDYAEEQFNKKQKQEAMQKVS